MNEAVSSSEESSEDEVHIPPRGKSILRLRSGNQIDDDGKPYRGKRPIAAMAYLDVEVETSDEEEPQAFNQTKRKAPFQDEENVDAKRLQKPVSHGHSNPDEDSESDTESEQDDDDILEPESSPSELTIRRKSQASKAGDIKGLNELPDVWSCTIVGCTYSLPLDNSEDLQDLIDAHMGQHSNNPQQSRIDIAMREMSKTSLPIGNLLNRIREFATEDGHPEIGSDDSSDSQTPKPVQRFAT